MSVSLMVAMGPVTAVAEPVNVYWTATGAATLNKTNVVSGTTTQLTSTNGRLQDVDLDAGTNTLYFSDWGVPGFLDPSEGAIHRIQTDGNGLGLVLGGGVIGDAVHQLALDTANNRIYFTRAVSYADREISRVDMNGANYTQLHTGAGVGSNGWFYSGLAVDVTNNAIYWGDVGLQSQLPAPPADGAVNTMTLAGTALTTLVPHVEGKGRGFALDEASQTLFYTAHDFRNPESGGSVFSYDIVNDIETLLISDTDTGYWDIEIDPSTNRLWWTDNGRGQIWSANFDGSNPVVELTGLTDIYGLALEIAGIIYVDDNAPNDPAPGIPGEFIGDANFSDPNEDGSCDHPFDSIQKAIQKATADEASNARITVLDGTYTGVGNYDIDPNGLPVKIKSGNGPKSCIIDCQGQARAFIFQSGENTNTIVSGLKITHGNSAEHAGAIYCQNSSPTIEDCIITRNYAAWSGGAILLDDSNAVISQCRITYNKCEASGAAICSITGSPTVINSLIAYNDGYFSGAASSVYDSNITFINCTIADNSAEHEIGTGGVYCWDGNSIITNSILWGNNSYYNNQIELFYGDETAVVTYSNIQMTSGTWPGTGNINAEPLFAGAKWLDYHLKSTAGCWNPILQTDGDFNDDGIIDNFDYAVFAMFWLDTGPAIPADLDPDSSVNFKDLKVFTNNWLKTGANTGGWVTDDVNSPCIDAGDPNSALPLEPAPNGGIINIGAYGNTEHASKSP